MRKMNFYSQLYRSFQSLPPQTGIVYVVLLIYLTIMTCLGLAFINKVGIEAKIVMNSGKGDKAECLARSAASHAMWGLTNVPGFAPANNIYYMQDFAGGRYGYKVRKPTLTTYATIATIGVMGDSVMEQGYVPYIIPSNVYTIYGSNTNSLPLYRRLIAADWSNPGTIATGGSPTIYWAELEGCPIRDELIGGVIDSNSDIKIAVWDGSSWGNLKTFSLNADMNYKCFDIAYESKSGKGVVVGRDGTATPLKFMVWNGINWPANPQTAFSLPGGDVHDVVMASDPGSDEILIAVVTSLDDIQLVQWNGSAFNDLGTIETTAARNDFRLVEIIYEHQSGDAMVVWSRNAEGALRYRMWNGTALGPEGSLPDFGGNENYVIRGTADSDPTSDYIVVAAIDNFFDINVAVWDGNAWIDSREIEISSSNYNVNSFDVAWEAAGEDAVIAWAYWGSGTFNRVYSLKWKKGTSLASSTVQVGPDCLAQLWAIRLLPISGTEKIVCLAENNSNNLYYCLWTGNSFKGNPAILLESNVTSKNDVAFALAEANVPRTGGAGGGGGTNQPPVVEAGPNQTIYLPGNATLDGTVTDDGLPSPPATVTATWSKISGPGTVTFGNPSQIDTTATISAAGTYVLRLTADDSDLSAYDEVTITISKSCSVLFVVPDAMNLGSLDVVRKALLESWGFAVVPFTAAQPQGEYDLAVSKGDVVYVSSTVNFADVTSKLKAQPVGVVNEVSALTAYLGFTSGSSVTSGTQTAIVDNTHEITSVFGTGNLSITSSTQSLHRFVNTMGPGFQKLTTTTFSIDPMLMTLETGDELLWGGVAPARRVMLPWGGSTFNVSELTSNGQTILMRSLKWAAPCDSGGSLLFVVNNAASLTAQDTAKKALMEGWGWIVKPISAAATQAAFDAAVLSANVAYVSDGINASDLGTKLKAKTIGVVNEHPSLHSVFGFSTVRASSTGNPLLSTTSTHYITSPFGGGAVALFAATQTIGAAAGTLASGLEIIGTWGGGSLSPLGGLLVLEAGATISGGGTAAGRRVQMPWGGAFNVNGISIYGLTILKRSLEWAGGFTEGGGGGGGDTTPPTPDPMTWSSPPAPVSPTSITMTATTAIDASGLEYYFECTAGGGHDSGWQDSTTHVDTGLTSSTTYTYRVKARDKSTNQNETGWSTALSATTYAADIYVHSITMSFYRSGGNYIAQATVWIKGGGGVNISGAAVTGTWSGVVSGTSMGTTGSGGTVTLDSPPKKNGGTFTFTVTDVSKSGYTYNPSMNVETSDSITAP